LFWTAIRKSGHSKNTALGICLGLIIGRRASWRHVSTKASNSAAIARSPVSAPARAATLFSRSKPRASSPHLCICGRCRFITGTQSVDFRPDKRCISRSGVRERASTFPAPIPPLACECTRCHFTTDGSRHDHRRLSGPAAVTANATPRVRFLLCQVPASSTAFQFLQLSKPRGGGAKSNGPGAGLIEGLRACSGGLFWQGNYSLQRPVPPRLAWAIYAALGSGSNHGPSSMHVRPSFSLLARRCFKLSKRRRRLGRPRIYYCGAHRGGPHGRKYKPRSLIAPYSPARWSI